MGTISGGATPAAQSHVPQLNNPAIKDKDNKQAQQLQKNLGAFYSDTFVRDYQAVQTAKDQGMDSKQAETALAADLATINNMQRELAHASGNTDLEKALKDDPSLISTSGSVAGDGNLDGLSTSSEILKGAGADPANKFTFSGVNNSADGHDDGSQKVTAFLQGSDVQATSAFRGGAGTAVDAQGKSTSSNESSNRDGAGTNVNWSGTSVSGQSATGGQYVKDGAQRTTQLALENIQTATPNQKATAFSYIMSLPDEASRSKALDGMLPQAKAAWADVQATANKVANAPDPSTNSNSFNALYNQFANASSDDQKRW